MLPATPAEPPYIAAYILERLRGNHPGVIEVEVRESGSESGIARHEQRWTVALTTTPPSNVSS